jgi:serine/threonine protein kinase
MGNLQSSAISEDTHSGINIFNDDVLDVDHHAFDDDPQHGSTYRYIHEVEDLEQYMAGGYCALMIDDSVNSSQYTILHKLGSDGNSIVWLARDQFNARNVALKVFRADAGADAARETAILQHISLVSSTSDHRGRSFVPKFFDEFKLQSANGTHCCIVTEAYGISVYVARYECGTNSLPKPVAQRVAVQASAAVSYIHACNIVHGGTFLSHSPLCRCPDILLITPMHTDISAQRLLFRMPGIENWSVEEVYGRLRTPQLAAIQRADGSPLTPGVVPTHAVHPPVQRWLRKYCYWDEENVSIMLMGFGNAFFSSSPRHTEPSYLCSAAPEILFKDEIVGPPADIWALAFALYEVLGDGFLLVGLLIYPDRDQVVSELVKIFGKLPERWTWSAPVDVVMVESAISLKERVRAIVKGGVHERFDEEELHTLENLFSKMLKYEPDKRIVAEEVLDGFPASWKLGFARKT